MVIAVLWAAISPKTTVLKRAVSWESKSIMEAVSERQGIDELNS